KDLKEAGLIQTAPAGIATATQQSQLHTANENIHLVSGSHTDITAGQSLTAHAAESLNLFAQSSGIKMQANQGKVEVQAQNDELQLNALKDATLTSSAGKITIAAKEENLITCKGAYIKFSNGEIEFGSPKVLRVRSPLVVTGPSSLQLEQVKTIAKTLKQGRFVLSSKPHGHGFVYTNEPYKLYKDGALLKEGLTDDLGAIEYEHDDKSKYKVELSNGAVFDITPPDKQQEQNVKKQLAQNLTALGYRHVEHEKTVNKDTSLIRYFKQSDKKNID
ncbi:TPA: DUF2345 domain-containing protein, partial [Neisseria subflava]